MANVSEGAKLLSVLAESGKIQVPAKYTPFPYTSPPNFDVIYEGSIHGISVCLGKPGQWWNASLQKGLIRYLGSDRTSIPDLNLSKHGLTPESARDFFVNEGLSRLETAQRQNWTSNKWPDCIQGVTYQTWRSP